MLDIVSKIPTENQNILIAILLIFIVSAEATAQFCLRKCKKEQKLHLFLLGVFFYSLVCIGLLNMYSMKEMGIVNFMWSCMSIVTILLIGIIVFHEEINRYDFVGLILVFIGLGLVFLKGH